MLFKIRRLYRQIKTRLVPQHRERWVDRLTARRRDRQSLRQSLLMVYKEKSLGNYLLYGTVNHLLRVYRNTSAISFGEDERPRDNPELGAPRLYREVDRYSPGALFAYGNPLGLNEVKSLKSRGINLIVNTDGAHSYYCGAAREQAEALEIFRHYDLYVVTHAPHAERLKAEGVHAVYVPMAYEPRWFYPLINTPPRYDILFVGSITHFLNQRRGEILQELSRHFKVTVLSNDRIPGANIEYLPQEYNPYRLNRLFNQARIVIGSDALTNAQELNSVPGQFMFYDNAYYIRQRVYPITGSGACYMVERHPEISRHFKDGEEIVLWGSLDELKSRVEYYLAHDDERRAIGLAAHRRASQEYTIAHMMDTIMRYTHLLRD